MTIEGEKDSLQATWSRFISGDQESFAVLYNQHIDTLYHYGTRLCKDKDAVKDALQELFLELFMRREKIRVTPENLKFYLMLALKRTLVKKLKSDRKISHTINESVGFEPQYSIEFQIMEKEKDAEINLKVANALNQLPAKQKEALYLRFNEALEYSEIAAILEITIESVRKQVHRGLKTVREIIGNEPPLILFTFLLKKDKKNSPCF